MKKTFALFTVLALLFTLLIPVSGFAQEDKELEKAIHTTKSLLNIADGYDDFNYNMNKRKDKTIYNLSWSDSKNKLGSVNVTIDSDGRITNYYCYKPYEGDRNMSRIPSVSKSDALKTANEFIKKVNPSIWGSLEYKENSAPMNIHDTNYDFYYVRMENKVQFPQNNVSVSVDCRTGIVQSFHCNWMYDLTFPSTSGVISLERAQQIFAEKLGLKLVYKMSYDGSSQTPYLAYSSVYRNKSIDAKTGEIINQNNYYYGAMEKAAGTYMDFNNEAKRDAKALTPQEKSAVDNAANLISEKKAEEIARKTLGFDSSFKLESINLYNNSRDNSEYIWSMHFNKEEKKAEMSVYHNASISIDAKTGDVLNFYRNIPYDPNTTVKYDKDQSLSIAQNYIKSMQPEKYGLVEYTTWGEPEIRPMAGAELPRQYYFSFTRKAGNAYFIDNGFNVTVDTTSGAVISYGLNWYKGDLPSQEKALSLDEAHKILFENVGIQLQYITDYSSKLDSRKIMPPPDGEIKPDIKLVYLLSQEKPANIDAISGKLLDYSGKLYEERTITQYTDISGNYAENQIKILAQYGISLPGSEFKSNQAITQREFLYLLVKSMDPYVSYKPTGDSKDDEALYNHLINAGIIKEAEKSPSSNVTKQDAVMFIIRALKYDRVADIKGIYTLPFKDAKSIRKDLYGYVAIAYGLNIIKDESGRFNPSTSMTRAASAAAIYNLLNIN